MVRQVWLSATSRISDTAHSNENAYKCMVTNPPDIRIISTLNVALIAHREEIGLNYGLFNRMLCICLKPNTGNHRTQINIEKTIA